METDTPRKKTYTKTITALNHIDIDKIGNEFRKNHSCHSTQTHVNIGTSGTIQYTQVIFYTE
jgi:hypothetical protein